VKGLSKSAIIVSKYAKSALTDAFGLVTFEYFP
jgi:hypothetical protein